MYKHKTSPSRTGKSKKSQSNGLLGTISDSRISRVAKSLYAIHIIKGDVPHSMTYEQFEEIFFKTASLYHALILNRGVDKGTKRFIEIRRYFLTFLIHGEAIVPDCLSVTKTGYPRDLRYLKKFAKVKNIKLLSTILNLTRLSQIGNIQSVDFSSIKSGISKNPKKVFNEFAQDLPLILKELNVEKATSTDLKFKWIDAQKKGPNSGLTKLPSIESSYVDIYALKKDLPLLNAIKNCLNKSENFGIVILLSKYLKYAEKNLSDSIKKSCWHSKLSKIPCPENKTRTVAIIDYWSQSILHMFLPIIDSVETKLTNSFMYDQDAGRERVREYTLTDNPVSLDGKDFTDRFHFKLQEIVMNNLFNDPFIVKWFFHILRGRGFRTSKVQKLVFYKIGQPMGANGSFQLANLTHSLFALWCCYKATKQKRGSAPPISELMKFTAVVGDDIVFKYKYHANFYRQKMQAIGLEFSDSKGFVSKNGVRVAEFCKRTYLNGTDISAFSPRPASNFHDNDKHVFSFATAYKLTDDQVYDFVNNLKPNRRSNVVELVNFYNIFKRGSEGLYTQTTKCDAAIEMIDHIEYGKASTKHLQFDYLFRYYILKEVQQRCFFLASPDRTSSLGRKLSLSGFVDYQTYQNYANLAKGDINDPLLGTILEAQVIEDPFDTGNLLLSPTGYLKASRLTKDPIKVSIDFKIYQPYSFEKILEPYKGTMLAREVLLDFMHRTVERKQYDDIRFWFAKTARSCLRPELYDFS